MFYFLLVLLTVVLLFVWTNYNWGWKSLTLNKMFKRDLVFRLANITFANIVTAALLAIAGSTVLSPLYWEFPLQTVVLVDKDGTIRDSSNFLGVLDVPWSKHAVVNLARDIYESKITIQPVTANPKVRHLVSKVSARISDEQTYLLSVPEAVLHKGWFGGDNHPDLGPAILRGQVESAIYEFHEKYSVELGAFYNPHDASQQKKFYELVAKEIMPKLSKKGIEVTDAKFSM